MSEHRVVSTHELRDGVGVAVDVGDERIAVFRVGDEFFALSETCPHRGAPLSQGEVRNGIVTCPWHAWQFSLADGRSPVNPDSRVRCYEVRVKDDAVWLVIPD